MVAIGASSVFTVACALERARFWTNLLKREGKVVSEVLEMSRSDLSAAAAIAAKDRDLPISRFLLAPLSLKNPSPETFRLALENAGDKEFVKMRKGDKLLETVVALAPLLGLLGTVTGLIQTFEGLNVGAGAGGEGAAAAAGGIGEALITTAAGMIVAIMALVVLRVMVTLQGQQMDYFSETGNELELIYRECWYEAGIQPHPGQRQIPAAQAPQSSTSSRDSSREQPLSSTKAISL